MEIGLIVLCYLIGSIPFAWIVVKLVNGKGDHTMIKENWPNRWAFLIGPRRKTRP